MSGAFTMPIDILDKHFVERCADIDSPEEYQKFLADIREMAKGHNLLPVIQQILGPSNTGVEQAKALICVAIQNTDNAPSKETLDSLLSQESNPWCIAAASLYLITQRADDDAYFRKLLLAPDSFTPSKASKDACYFLIKFMGFSGNTRFVPLLYEILTKHYHFCSQSVTANALKNLGEEPDEDEIPYTRSISVTDISSGILIYTDDKYTGSSNCPDCRFFPCRINHYYAGGIQDCSLWNKTDSGTLGELRDKRDWGEHLVPEELETDNLKQKEIWIQARKLMVNKSYCQAIPFLCYALLLGEHWNQESKSNIPPLAWIYLSHCFSVHGEKKLAFIAMREALRYKNLIPHTKVAEQRKLESFDDNPETILGKITNPSNFIQNMEIKATNYKDRNQWVKAIDCYVYANICDAGKSGGNWFEMGECHRKLDEDHLAELFMRRGAAITPDNELTRKFFQGADEVHKILLKKRDTGLSLERRREERKPIQPKIEYGFSLDTYKFEEINETAKQATQNCRGIGDYYDSSKAAYERGELELAIEIMKAAVNYTPFYTSKARPLYMAARLQFELQEYDKAMKYLDWAMELKPDDENIRNVWTSLKTEMGRVE